jgi:hypothetical protein
MIAHDINVALSALSLLMRKQKKNRTQKQKKPKIYALIKAKSIDKNYSPFCRSRKQKSIVV